MVISFKDAQLEQTIHGKSNKSSPGLVAKRDLGRLYWVLSSPAAFVQLTEAEFSLVCDALNAIEFSDPEMISIVPARVEQSIRRNRLDKKWEVDGEALIAKLRGCSELQCLYLVDRVEQFWDDRIGCGWMGKNDCYETVRWRCATPISPGQPPVAIMICDFHKKEHARIFTDKRSQFTEISPREED